MPKYFDITIGDTVPSDETAAIYVRQSRARQKSLDEQEAECLEDAEDCGDRVVASYSDKVSASRFSTKERPGWEQCLADFREGMFKKLYLWESSRGERDAANWLALLTEIRSAGLLLRITGSGKTYDIQKNAQDWKDLADEGLDNQHESEKISLRVARGQRQNAKKGRPHGKVTYGYRRVYQMNGAIREFVRQEVDDEPRTTPNGETWTPAQVVRDMFRDALAGAPLSAIARELNQLGIPTPSLQAILNGGASAHTAEELQERRWRSTQVRYLLLNEAYLGVRRHHRCQKGIKHNCEDDRQATAEAAWPALIEPTDFWDVKTLLLSDSRLSGQVKGVKTVPKYLLSCIAKCECGNDMIYLSPAKDGRRPRAYYRCRLSHCAVAVEEADAYVTAWVVKWLANTTNWLKLQASLSGSNEKARKSHELLARLQSELAEWEAAMVFDPNNPDRARPSLEMFSRQQIALTAEIDRLQAAVYVKGIPGPLKPFAGKSEEEVWAVWKSPDFAVLRKRAVVSTIARVTVFSAGKGKQVPAAQRMQIAEITLTAA